MTLLANLVEVSARVTRTASRLGKIAELAGLLRVLAPEEIEIAVRYLAGELPQGRLGVGYATLQSASSDPPAAAASLSVAETDRRLAALGSETGAGSAARRQQLLRELFGLTTAAERGFLMALLVGELRQGALSGVMVDAIASASALPVAQIRRAAMFAPNLGAVARIALLEGDDSLRGFELRLFSPVAPMLAQTAADVAEALAELPGELAFEWKMDGARIQVHKGDDEVRIFTRTLNEVTGALPEIVQLVQGLAARELVLDGEAVAFDAAQRPHPFQITMRRFGRKLDIERMLRELPMQAFFFDCLLLDGRSLTELSTQERYRALEAAVPTLRQMPRLITAQEPEALSFYQAALAAGHEGIMAKALDAPYEAGNRDARWLKIKRAHTLDLVVLAAEWGHGRRSGKLSNLHLGALDTATGAYVMLGKTFKGLTDAMLVWQTEQFLLRETHRDDWTVYVRPELVVEIAFSDLQASRRYPGGLALRLARVKRYRDDKTVAEADTMESVRRVFAAQSGALAP